MPTDEICWGPWCLWRVKIFHDGINVLRDENLKDCMLKPLWNMSTWNIFQASESNMTNLYIFVYIESPHPGLILKNKKEANNDIFFKVWGTPPSVFNSFGACCWCVLAIDLKAVPSFTLWWVARVHRLSFVCSHLLLIYVAARSACTIAPIIVNGLGNFSYARSSDLPVWLSGMCRFTQFGLGITRQIT